MDHATTPTPQFTLTEGQLSESLRLIAADTEIRIRWDQEAYAARCEEEANTREIEAALAQRALDEQP